MHVKNIRQMMDGVRNVTDGACQGGRVMDGVGDKFLKN